MSNCKTVGKGIEAVALLREQVLDPSAEGMPPNGDIPRVSFPELEIPAPEDVKAETEAIAEEIRKTRQLVETRLPQLLRYEEVKDAAYRERFRSQAEGIRKALKSLLSHAFPAYRKAAIATYVKVMLSRPHPSKIALAETLARLCAEGCLTEDERGKLKINGMTYRPAVELSEDELDEIAMVLGRASKTARSADEARAQAMIEDWKHIPGLITWEELLGHQPGKFIVGVPPEKVTTKEGQYWRGGGHLLMESDGRNVRPIDVVSPNAGFVASVKEAKTLKVHLLIDALGRETAPYVKGLIPEMGTKVRLLWYLLDRGRKAQVAQEEAAAHQEQREREMETLKAEMAEGKATLDLGDFFLKKQPGVALVVFDPDPQDWETPEGEEVPDLFFLIERKETDDTTLLQIVEVPPHLADFLSGCIDEYPEEEKFEGLPQPLKAILQAVYGQVSRSWPKE